MTRDNGYCLMNISFRNDIDGVHFVYLISVFLSLAINENELLESVLFGLG